LCAVEAAALASPAHNCVCDYLFDHSS
jgi:hypothetical protein